MFDNLIGGDDEPTSDEDDAAEGADPFDESGDPLDGDDLMGDADEDLMGDADADLMGDADADLMGDGDLDGGELDGGASGGGPSNTEVDKRMDELENEVDSVSSSLETVKRENEQISESIDDVEENVRKLLEIYEMVTQGVNPFVDGSEIGEGFGGDAGGSEMGLFDDEGDDEETEAVDESVATADAEEFFDEDIDDDVDGDQEIDDPTADAEGEDASPDAEPEIADDIGPDDGATAGTDSPEGVDADDGEDQEGRSFEDLKAEYEAAAAEMEADGESDEGEPESAAGTAAGTAAGHRDDPYLETLPSGYVVDLVVMDWLEFLVDEAGVDGAARTVAYYEAIGWLGAPAADRLRTFLGGFGDDVDPDPEPRSSLTVAHHDASLRYIGRIANPSMEAVAFDDATDHSRGGPSVGDVGSIDERYPDVPASVGPSTRRAAMESDGGHLLPSDGLGVTPDGRPTATGAEEHTADARAATPGGGDARRATSGEGVLYRGGFGRGSEGDGSVEGPTEDPFIWGEDRQ